MAHVHVSLRLDQDQTGNRLVTDGKDEMSDIRTRLTDALAAELELRRGTVQTWGAHIADVLLSLPGIAIIELPEADGGKWPVDQFAWDLLSDDKKDNYRRWARVAIEATGLDCEDLWDANQFVQDWRDSDNCDDTPAYRQRLTELARRLRDTSNRIAVNR